MSVGLAQAAAETRAWNGRRDHYGSVSFKQGHRLGWRDALAYVGPTWLTITPAQRLEHIEQCRDMCFACADHRAIGVCVSCGDTKEALPPFGESRCCGSQVAFPPEVS